MVMALGNQRTPRMVGAYLGLAAATSRSKSPSCKARRAIVARQGQTETQVLPNLAG